MTTKFLSGRLWIALTACFVWGVLTFQRALSAEDQVKLLAGAGIAYHVRKLADRFGSATGSPAARRE